MQIEQLKKILEAILLAADRTLSVIQLDALFELDEDRPTRDEIRKALHEMAEDYANRGYELKQVGSGFRLQVRQEFAAWVGRLWEEKPARYTRALLETIALIAYRQPITRGEIEEVRGVSVSSSIIKTLLEREWIKVLGHKDVPGKPALYGTTREFLDYFNLKSLDELPTLAEIKDLDDIHPELALNDDGKPDTENAESNNSQASDEPVIAQTETESIDDGDTDIDRDSADTDLQTEAPVVTNTDAEVVTSEEVAQAEEETGEQSSENDKLPAASL